MLGCTAIHTIISISIDGQWIEIVCSDLANMVATLSPLEADTVF
eukprot:SAG31_NODE_2600_length_5414_cov_3.077140_5_plen_44_part_00